MKKQILTALILVLLCGVLKAQSTFDVGISFHAEIESYEGEIHEEWIHLKLTDSLNSKVYFDSLITMATEDTIYKQFSLPPSLYKCEVLDISANTSMPNILLQNDSLVKYGYPEFNFYLFQLPLE